MYQDVVDEPGGGQAGEGSASMSGADAWTRVKRRLRAELGEDVFMSWLARLELDAIRDGAATLSVPTRFLKSWIEAHYLDRVLSTFASELDAWVVAEGIETQG